MSPPRGPEGRPLLSLLPPPPAWRPAVAGLPLDVAAGTVLAPAGPRRLLPQEQAALAVLLTRELGTVDQLMTALWGAWLEPPDSAASALRVVIAGLRTKLAGTGALVLNVVGVGYRLVVPGNDDDPPPDHPSSSRISA